MTPRFWVVDDREDVAQSTDRLPWGEETVGIADETEGGITMYAHRDLAPSYVLMLNGD